MSKQLAERAMAAAGDYRYDDYVTRDGLYDPAELEAFDQGCHYDYRAQVWRDGHDHAHTDASGILPLLYCGADASTCLGVAL